MKKLQNKLFLTISLILSLCLITILFIFNYQDYNRTQNEIKRNLFKMSSNKDKELFLNNEIAPTKPNIFFLDDNNPKKFMDTTIYTILLDKNNNINDIISHRADGTFTENIENIARQIILTNNKSKIHIGNLYFEKYSYNYNVNNYITLIDNTEINEKLTSSLQISICLFILLEIIILSLAHFLSKWLIKPVKLSFDKQKQFIADASHELKTPLAVIIASSEALEENPNEIKWLYNIKSEAERMNNLIKKLLDLAQLENKNQKRLYEMVNISKLIEMSILPFESLIYEKNINLDYNIENNINFKCNTDDIKQLVSILLDNAIKHSCQKGKIIVNLKENKNNITLEVINKGTPIPKGEEEKIFERFYRGDKSRNRESNRYGLGLAIAKRIVDNHNGKISACCSDDKYTTFLITFKK